MRLLIQHRNHYGYPAPAALGPHLIRLRPATHTRARIETYSLEIAQGGDLRWQQDPYGNHVARLTFRDGDRVSALDVLVEMAVDVRPVNPFDFFIDDRFRQTPFTYPEELRRDLFPFLEGAPAGDGEGRLAAFLKELPDRGDTVDLVVELNRLVSSRIRYVIREEPGVWTAEETVAAGRGSCRDSALLLLAALRSRGFAARFVSGYLVQLTDEGMIPNAPRGVGRDVVDLHAWAEVYLPGGGWIGLDATSGLLCGEGHIPLACTAHPSLAAPIEGTSDQVAREVSFAMKVGRLGHEPRPTAPYPEPVWEGLLEAGRLADSKLAALGLEMTMGGEPTFNAREHVDAPEWNGAALGPTKWRLGLALVDELRRRLSPGAVVLLRSGKLYPGESLPRWALEICGRRDGVPLWSPLPARDPARGDGDDARRFAEALARRLGLDGHLHPAFEDPWRFLQDEASLPVDVDPLAFDLDDPLERRRLARVLDRGLSRPAGYVLPLAWDGRRWASERWELRRGHLFLVPGDSPIGLRLPLRSLSQVVAPPPPPEEPFSPPDPRRGDVDDEGQPRRASSRSPAGFVPTRLGIRTALCVEPRDGALHLFLPPLPTAADFFALLAEVDAARRETGVDVRLEGYPPPSSPALYRFAVTPDPGVLEVNLPPTDRVAEYAALVDTVYEAALHCGLHSEKYLLDGRMAGSGGGNHLTLGGPTPLRSPFLARPDLLASLITFFQHHPSLSYLFTGLFVGPTSQAPRVDEARQEVLYDLDIALARAFESRGESSPPWLADALFRHLLVDVAGNTHRSEICIDKLFDPQTSTGRQGLIELRAFEMPPHPRMVVAQMVLVRALVAAFAEEPYRAPLCRFGQALHDRYLLPYWLWRDFEEVLAFLAAHGIPIDPGGYRPFLELRCPVAGTLQAGDVRLEVRNAFEPWPVLGEELTGSGTSRFVDSSMERIEVRVEGLLPERHEVLVNGHHLPLRPTPIAGEYVGGVRFRAWAPAHSLHPHLGIHHPIRFDVLDTWARRSLGACAYHVWHPEGRGFESPPLTRFEAAARRSQRFTSLGHLQWPVMPQATGAHPEAPYTLDLRRFPMDHPMPKPEP